MADPWFYEDVAFSHADADAAIAALQQVRLYVNALYEVRATASPDALDGWTGRFAEDFTRELTSTQQGLDDVVATIDRTIGSIEGAKTSATEEQQRRVQLREDHEEAQAQEPEPDPIGGPR